MRLLVGFGRFWWEFIVGDDWKIAAGLALVLTAGALLVAYTDLSDTVVALITGGGILASATASIFAGAVAAARRRP